MKSQNFNKFIKLQIPKLSFLLYSSLYGLALAVSSPEMVKAEMDLQSFEYWASLCSNWEAAVNNKNYEEALKACDNALSIQEKKPELWLARGNVLLAFNKFPEAIASYQRMISLDGNNSEGWTQICLALSESEQYPQAIAACEKALKIDNNWGRSTPAVAFNYRGVALSKFGRAKEARESFDLATKLNPDYSLAWTNSCVALYEIGELQTALKACDRALESNQFWGNYSPALGWANRGKVTQTMGLYDESLKAYNKAIAINNSDGKIWTEYGILLNKLGKYSQAEMALETAVKIIPNNAFALVNQCANLNRLRKYEKALTACETALQKSDNVWGSEGIALAWNQYGNALTGSIRYDEAIAAFNRAISLNPNYASAWSNRSVALWYQGKYDEALESNNRALEIDPKSSQAWYNQGRIYTSQGKLESVAEGIDVDSALEAYNEALKGDGFAGDKLLLSEVWVNQSATLLRLKRYSEAINAADNAIGINPQSADAWYNKALGLMALQRYEDAVKIYQRAITIKPENANFWAGKGIALRLLKNYPAANEALEKALKFNPDHPQAKANLVIVKQRLQSQIPQP